MATHKIAIVKGDGIGVDVVNEGMKVLDALAPKYGISWDYTEFPWGSDYYFEHDEMMPANALDTLADFNAVFLGAVGHPDIQDNITLDGLLLPIRRRFDQYICLRPSVLYPGVTSPLSGKNPYDIDLTVVRENTEGAYTGMGGSFKTGTSDEVAIEEDVNTRKGVERIIWAAFEFAGSRGRGRVTLVDKANVQRHAGGLWRRVFAEVGAAYADIEQDAMYVDAMVMDLVRRPERYEVIVTSNLFGDIVSDLAAEVTGGLGLAPSANIHPGRVALFEPVHGSAPDIAGKGIANPIGAIRCVSLMLDHFGRSDLGERVEAAVAGSVEAGKTTPDLGGEYSTEDVGQWITARVVGVHAAST